MAPLLCYKCAISKSCPSETCWSWVVALTWANMLSPEEGGSLPWQLQDKMYCCFLKKSPMRSSIFYSVFCSGSMDLKGNEGRYCTTCCDKGPQRLSKKKRALKSVLVAKEKYTVHRQQGNIYIVTYGRPAECAEYFTHNGSNMVIWGFSWSTACSQFWLKYLHYRMNCPEVL